MALDKNQIAGLDDLNKRIAGGYQATAQDTANLNYGKSKGYAYNPIPEGATKIAGPSGLQGLNESQIFRQGQDIYRLPDMPEIPTSLSSSDVTETSIKPVELEPNTYDSMIKGLDTTNKGIEANVKSILAPLPQEKELNAVQKRQAEYTEANKTANLDLQQKTQEDYQLKQNALEVQKIMPQIARLQAEFDNAMIAQEGRKGTASSIYGRQALLQREKAVELAGLSAVAQAYQGNVDLARQISQDAVNAQFQDQQNYNEGLKTQLDYIYKDLDREEKKQANALNLIIAEREREIETEKQNRQGIFDIALTASEKSVSSEVATKILNAKTPEQAMKIAFENGVYNSTSAPIKVGQNSNGDDIFYDENTGTFRTGDQLVSYQLGNQEGTIKGLPAYNTRAANPGVVRSDRNNNPGNIKVSDYTKDFEGVIGVESSPAGDGGNFLIFENAEAGINAIGRLLLEGNSYQGVTAEQAIKKYNGNGGYSALNVGLDPNKNFQEQIQDPNKRYQVARAIAMAEGWSGNITESISPRQAELTDLAKGLNDGSVKFSDIPQDDRATVNSIARTLPPSDAKIKENEEILRRLKELKDHEGLKSSVGPTAISRGGIFGVQGIGGKKDAFLGKADTIISKKSLDALIEAKSQGATFGALSDTEMAILRSAATTIGAWEKTDKNGKLKGFDVSEKEFIKELDTLIKDYENLLLKAGSIKSLDTYLNDNPSKVSDYNKVVANNPELSDEEILQIIQ